MAGGCGILTNSDPPPTDCKLDVDCYVRFALTTVTSIGKDINYWSNWLTYALLASIVFGVIATVMIGLQGDNNKHRTRPIGLVATTLGAAVTTMLSTFHIQDNVDKLIDIRSRVTQLANNLEHDATGKTSEELKEVLWQYSSNFNEITDERTKLKGSAGHLNINPTGPAPQPKSTPGTK
jgi:hypothetical protein